MPPNQDTEVDDTLNDLISIVPTRFENKMDLVRIKEEAKTALNQYYKSILLEAVEGAEIDSNFSSHAQNGFVMAKSVIREHLESRLG